MRWSSALASVNFLSMLLLPAAARPQEGTLLPFTRVVLLASPEALTDAERGELDAWLKGMRKWQKTDKQ